MLSPRIDCVLRATRAYKSNKNIITIILPGRNRRVAADACFWVWYLECYINLWSTVEFLEVYPPGGTHTLG